MATVGVKGLSSQRRRSVFRIGEGTDRRGPKVGFMGRGNN